ncbi:MAG TPA: helix-turn-helix domain-containing protein, partial [Candidatus Binatia bacterium]|nr:helix-turn-helix domain-containing protein [Candidatus Binatia bacterium]
QPWHGNVRELRNVVRKALLAARGRCIDRPIIAQVLDETGIFRRPPAPAHAGQSVADHVSQLLDNAERGECEDAARGVIEWAEREIYGQAIRLAEGDQSRASQWLGVDRRTVREKLSRCRPGPASPF